MNKQVSKFSLEGGGVLLILYLDCYAYIRNVTVGAYNKSTKRQEL